MTRADTMDETMDIRLGCLRHRQYFLPLCTTEWSNPENKT